MMAPGTAHIQIDPAALLALLAERDAAIAAREKDIKAFKAQLRGRDLLIEKLRFQLAGLRRHRFGATSEALDQLEPTLEEAEIARAAESGSRRHRQGASRCPATCRATRPCCRPVRLAVPAVGA
jgi:hypothetical protein